VKSDFPEIKVILENMPDPFVARKNIWLDHMKNGFECDESTLIVGHSSGAEAAMRYAELNKVFGIVLVSACHTDLGDSNEKKSGYYEDPWDWEAIRKNTRCIIQFGSSDDPFIPIDEMRFVSENLGSDYMEYEDKGHFQKGTFKELKEKLYKVLSNMNLS